VGDKKYGLPHGKAVNLLYSNPPDMHSPPHANYLAHPIPGMERVDWHWMQFDHLLKISPGDWISFQEALCAECDVVGDERIFWS